MIAALVTAGTWLLALGPGLASSPSTSPGSELHESRADRPLEGLHDVQTLRAREPHMVLVRRSTFRMGSTSDEIVATLVQCSAEPRGPQCEDAMFADELPARNVTLDAYWLDAFETTVSEYEACVRAGRCAALPYPEGASRFLAPDFPVSLVTWHEALEYCAFRNARLPTEAEFERAARGPAGRRYPWGNLYNSRVANHGRFDWDPADPEDGASELARVGSYPGGRTPDGIHDLAGNVAEWTLDRYAERYAPGDATNPTGPSSTTGSPLRVVRGGSYESAPPWLRGAAREAALPSARSPAVGFRCARSQRSSPDAPG